MNVVIMGCGRLGSRIAAMLERQGHAVTVIDINESAFRRLPEGFGGRRIV
ncbi:MAG: potassium transporter TrkA, partial [Chloroflexota bacterium]